MSTKPQDPLVRQYLIDIGRFAPLSKAEQICLGERFKRGDAAAGERLIRHNLKLVVSIARMYRCQGVAFLDLIQIGNMGLLKAIKKYDPIKGIKFSSYVNERVHRRLQKAVADPEVIHVPDSTLKIMRQFAATGPTDNGCAHKANGRRAGKLSALRIAGLRVKSMRSLDVLMGDREESLGEFMYGNTGLPEATVRSELIQEALTSALEALNPHEQKIVRLLSVVEVRNGFGFSEVARRFSPPISREWVRRIIQERIRPKLLANPFFAQAYKLWCSPG